MLVDRMLTERRTAYIVVNDTGTVVGVITLANLQGALETPQTTVDDIMTENPPMISADATAFELFTTLGQGRGEYVFLEEDDQTIGLISQTDFMQMLSLLEGARQLRHAVPLTR
jgi:CBS domain-containing protein